MINQETIARILDAAQIEEVIGDYVYLKKTGANFKGLSPFKQEKTPSFVVSPSKQIFKCFSTGKGGNVFSFLMEHEQMSYPEALKHVAKRYNIEVEETLPSPEQAQAQSRRESLSVIMKFASSYFQTQLHETDAGKSIALSYLKNRGVSIESIKEFGLGWCPDGGDAFLKAAKKKGFKAEYLEDLGLIKNYGARSRDFYSGRVIFPISSVSGVPLAFAGRTLHKDGKAPKYINSPETELYHKSKVLYAIHQARGVIAKEELCYITEGYTDVIAMHQAGVKNVVATAGTALTKEQAYLIKRYSKNVCLLYDGDAAGVKAALRGIDILLSEGLTVYVLNLPAEHDPDSFSRGKSTEELKQYLQENKKDFVAYKASLFLKGITDPIKRSEGIRDIVKSIALVDDAILRDLYIKQCATDYNIDQATLLQEVAKTKRSSYLKTRDKTGEKVSENDYHDHDPFTPAPKSPEAPIVKSNTLEIIETELVRLMVLYGQEKFILQIKSDDGSVEETEHFVQEFIIDIIQAEEIAFTTESNRKLLDLFIANPNISNQNLMAASPPEVHNLLSDMMYNPYSVSENWDKKHAIKTETEAEKLGQIVPESIYAYLLQTVRNELSKNEEKLKNVSDFEEITKLLNVQRQYLSAKKTYSSILHRVILHG